VCFAAPILWQQWTVPAGNLAALWSFAREGEWGSQSPSHAVIIVLSRLAALPSSLLRLIDIDVIARSPWLLSVNTTFLLGSAFFALRDRTSRHGAPMLLVALFALLLGALAALRVTGPLHPYLLRFEFAAATLLGLSSLLYLCAAIEPLRRYCDGHARIKIFAIAMALVILLRPEMPVANPSPLAAVASDIVAISDAAEVELDLEYGGDDHPLWGKMTGLVLRLRRAGLEVFMEEGWNVLVAGNRQAPTTTSMPLVHLDSGRFLELPNTSTARPVMHAVQIDRSLDRRFAVLRWRGSLLKPMPFGSRLRPRDASLLFDGWHGDEVSFRWSRRPESHLIFRLDGDIRCCDLMLSMDVGVVGDQTVTIELNGQQLVSRDLSGFGPYSLELTLPRSALDLSGVQILTVRVPGARAASEDSPRILGMHVGAITVNLQY
jgi:hypothetical protein